MCVTQALAPTARLGNRGSLESDSFHVAHLHSLSHVYMHSSILQLLGASMLMSELFQDWVHDLCRCAHMAAMPQ
jgi:hypothetical protein